MDKNEPLLNPRVVVIQKLYTYHINKESKLSFPKHRYKKFIKDVVNGTIERKDLIQNLMDKELKDHINENKTELMINKWGLLFQFSDSYIIYLYVVDSCLFIFNNSFSFFRT